MNPTEVGEVQSQVSNSCAYSEMEERTMKKKVYMMLIVLQNDLVDGVFVLLGSDAAEFVLVDLLNDERRRNLVNVVERLPAGSVGGLLLV